VRFKNYDYYLIVLTMLILFSIGVISLYGITYYNYLAIDPRWTMSAQYSQYIDEMNSYLYPFLVLILISLGLCIPKRLFEQDTLLRFSMIVIGMTVIITIFSDMEKGLSFILVVMMVVQIFVLAMTIKKSNKIRFEKEGYIGRIGSSLLHLGSVIIILDFVSLRDTPFHLLIFWSGMIFLMAGNVLSFYPEEISSLLPDN